MSVLMEHGNGTRGRVAPALPAHTFADSGITIRFRKVGPTTQQRIAQAIQREHPDPPVPIVETELGNEPNPADPAYQAACAACETERTRLLSERLLLIAALEAEVSIDEDARRDIARRKRSLELAQTPWAPDPALTDEENERVFYVLYVAAASPEDLKEFGAVILRRSVPTEEAVQTQIATFQRDVPGA